MKQNVKDRAKGAGREIKGKAKETVGRATRNPDMEAEGKAEKWAGRARRKVGEVEKVFGK